MVPRKPLKEMRDGDDKWKLRHLSNDMNIQALFWRKKEGSGYLVIVEDDDQDRPQQWGIDALSEDWLLTVCKGCVYEW